MTPADHAQDAHDALLPERLVDAALELLEEHGPQAVTLRAVARHAEVSHGAPRRHFPTHAGLLSAVARRGFEQLAVDVLPALQEPAAAPLDRLDAACRAYLSFATARPHLYALMFRHDLLVGDEPGLRHTSLPLFGALVELVEQAQEGGWRTGTPAPVLAGSLWSGVHGLVQLWSWGALPLAVGDHELDAMLGTTLDAWRAVPTAVAA